eukprot:4209692-Amphidinium_carterae.1
MANTHARTTQQIQTHLVSTLSLNHLHNLFGTWTLLHCGFPCSLGRNHVQCFTRLSVCLVRCGVVSGAARSLAAGCSCVSHRRYLCTVGLALSSVYVLLTGTQELSCVFPKDVALVGPRAQQAAWEFEGERELTDEYIRSGT